MYSDPIPVAQVAARRRFSVWFWIALGGGILFLLLLTCAGIGGATAYSFTRWMSVASKKVDETFVDLDQDRFADIYATKFSNAYRKVVTPRQHAEFGELFHRGLGRLKSKSMQSMNRQTYNGDSCILAIYNGQFEKGQGTIKVTLVWEDGDWKFHEFRVQSPLFSQMVKCPNCGAAHSMDARFCPKCGKAIGGGK